MELREEASGQFVVVAGDEVKGRVSLEDGPAGPTAVCGLDWLDRDEAKALVRELDVLGVQRIDAQEMLVRLEARNAGFGGTLREPLSRGAAPFPTETAPQVEHLLPATRVRELPHRAPWRRWVAHATRGMSGMTRLSVEPTDGRPDIRVHMPGREDQIAEAIALAVDTALGVHARFGRAVDHVRQISFDHSMHEMTTGEVAGAAPQNLGLIHINANFSFVAGLDSLARARAGRLTGGRYESPAAVSRQWTAMDGTVAHELWHKIEMAWEARNYRDTIEFRRELGGWFGHATLEQVFGDPDARAALAAAVSPYAATNRLEATAEMFKLWWCGPPPSGSMAERFGELVERYFPR